MSNVSLITSGTSGIGKAIVKKIVTEAAADDLVIVNYGHNDEAARQLDEELSDRACRLVLIKADMSDYDEMLVFAQKVREETDHIDWCVMNTGIGTYLPFEEYTIDVWRNVMDTNVTIPAFLVKELKPLFAEDSNLVFMGSHAGQAPYSSSVVYSVSKAAVMFLAKSLVKVLNDKRVAVNSIAPGFIETRWQNGRSDESYERINRKIGAHRFGTPEEVASLCYEILNNDYLSGSCYDVHGGYDYF